MQERPGLATMQTLEDRSIELAVQAGATFEPAVTPPFRLCSLGDSLWILDEFGRRTLSPPECLEAVRRCKVVEELRGHLQGMGLPRAYPGMDEGVRLHLLAILEGTK